MTDGLAEVVIAASGSRRDLLVVFTDGTDTSSFLTTAQVLESARYSGVTVYGVSVRGSGRSPFLRDLTALTGGELIEIESTRDLRHTFVSILEEFRQRYLLSYTPRGVSNAGWHRLQVGVKSRRATVTARTGYMAESGR